MHSKERKLTKSNIDQQIQNYTASVETIGTSVNWLTGRHLLSDLKRKEVGVGPYPEVTLFEAANRIMTDLVIYHGVKWLLESEIFPFSEYEVALGNEAKNEYDLMACNESRCLVGEAFNVAKSFFPTKKSSMLKKLRKAESTADYRLIMLNHDALSARRQPLKKEKNLYYVVVNIDESRVELLSN